MELFGAALLVDRRQQDDRHVAERRVEANRARQHRAIPVRHLEVGEHDAVGIALVYRLPQRDQGPFRGLHVIRPHPPAQQTLT